MNSTRLLSPRASTFPECGSGGVIPVKQEACSLIQPTGQPGIAPQELDVLPRVTRRPYAPDIGSDLSRGVRRAGNVLHPHPAVA